MINLNFYSIFHLNLMFSSIGKNERRNVIKKCYWPLLDIADSGIPLGIEAPGITLEIINEIDTSWIKQFRSLLNLKKLSL